MHLVRCHHLAIVSFPCSSQSPHHPAVYNAPHPTRVRWAPFPLLPPAGGACNSHLPVCVGIIDHQQDPGPLNNRCGGTQRLHQPWGGLRSLLHGTGEGAEKAGSWRGEGGCQGLGVPPLHGGGSRRAGGGVWALQVCHVAIGQVGHEAAVRQASPQEIHGCRWTRWLVLPQTGLTWGPEHQAARRRSSGVSEQRSLGDPAQVGFSGLCWRVEMSQHTR